MRRPEQPHGKIEKISIPDDDVGGWIETLWKNNFTPEEIDEILIQNNDEYARQKIRAKIPDLFERNREFLERHGLSDKLPEADQQAVEKWLEDLLIKELREGGH